jgi:hypothetical protein
MTNSTRLTLNIFRNLKLFSVRSDIREYLPNSRVVAASLSMDGVPITSLGEYRVQTLFFPRTVSYKINTYMSYALTWYIHKENFS